LSHHGGSLIVSAMSRLAKDDAVRHEEVRDHLPSDMLLTQRGERLVESRPVEEPVAAHADSRSRADR
jgi:hypothetical protein